MLIFWYYWEYLKNPKIHFVDYKKQYIQFSEEADLPLQMQPWWLDIVCGVGVWDVCLHFDKEGQIVGVLPFFIREKYFLHLNTMPPLTDYIGLFVKTPENETLKAVSKRAIEQKIIADLIDQLPSVHYFNQQYYPATTNWLPFYWKGYKQSTYYTFCFENQAIEKIYEGFKRTVWTDIKKAEKRVYSINSAELKDFYTINAQSFKRNRVDVPYEWDTLKALDEALAQRSQRQILLAKDKVNDEIHAALYWVWDEHTAYFLLSGLNDKYKNSAAIHLLYWEAIKQAMEMGKRVDFCGSMLPKVEHVLRSYGATLVPHFRIFKAKNKFWSGLFSLFNKFDL